MEGASKDSRLQLYSCHVVLKSMDYVVGWGAGGGGGGGGGGAHE